MPENVPGDETTASFFPPRCDRCREALGVHSQPRHSYCEAPTSSTITTLAEAPAWDAEALEAHRRKWQADRENFTPGTNDTDAARRFVTDSKGRIGSLPVDGPGGNPFPTYTDPVYDAGFVAGRAAATPELRNGCRAPHCFSEYGTPCGTCPAEKPETP